MRFPCLEFFFLQCIMLLVLLLHRGQRRLVLGSLLALECLEGGRVAAYQAGFLSFQAKIILLLLLLLHVLYFLLLL